MNKTELDEVLTCPNCDEPLVLRRGRYGDFLGCPNYPECRWTVSLATSAPRWGESKKINCSICKDTGLLPFKKEGKVIPNAFLDCECKEDKQHAYAYRPAMFDFPMSYDFYRSLCRQHRWPGPGPDEPTEPIEIIEPVFRPRPVDKEIDQLKAQVNNLTNKLAEMRAEKGTTGKDKSQSGGRAKPRFTGVI